MIGILSSADIVLSCGIDLAGSASEDVKIRLYSRPPRDV
jgi:hypothetical protein